MFPPQFFIYCDFQYTFSLSNACKVYKRLKKQWIIGKTISGELTDDKGNNCISNIVAGEITKNDLCDMMMSVDYSLHFFSHSRALLTYINRKICFFSELQSLLLSLTFLWIDILPHMKSKWFSHLSQSNLLNVNHFL